MNKDLIITEKLKAKINKLDFLNNETVACKKIYRSGSVKKMEDDFYIVSDQEGSNLGIFDPASFLKTMLSTELGFLWDLRKKEVHN